MNIGTYISLTGEAPIGIYVAIASCIFIVTMFVMFNQLAAQKRDQEQAQKLPEAAGFEGSGSSGGGSRRGGGSSNSGGGSDDGGSDDAGGSDDRYDGPSFDDLNPDMSGMNKKLASLEKDNAELMKILDNKKLELEQLEREKRLRNHFMHINLSPKTNERTDE